MVLPTQKDVEKKILRYLNEIGAPIPARDVYDPLARLFQLSDQIKTLQWQTEETHGKIAYNTRDEDLKMKVY